MNKGGGMMGGGWVRSFCCCVRTQTDGYFVIQLFPVRPTVCSLINASLLDTKRRDWDQQQRARDSSIRYSIGCCLLLLKLCSDLRVLWHVVVFCSASIFCLQFSCICSLYFIHFNRMQKGAMGGGGPGMGMKGGMGWVLVVGILAFSPSVFWDVSFTFISLILHHIFLLVYNY